MIIYKITKRRMTYDEVIYIGKKGGGTGGGGGGAVTSVSNAD